MDKKIFRQIEKTFFAFEARGEAFKDDPTDRHLLAFLEQAERSLKIIRTATKQHLGDKTPPWV